MSSASAPLAAPQFILEIADGPDTGRTIALAHGDLVIGRSSTCGITLAHRDVAPTHCGLRVRAEQVIVAPGGTVAKTRLNGLPLIKAQLLRVGDRLGVGPYELLLRIRTDGPEKVLHPGDRLGPWQITGELGSGAIGRVYEAADAAARQVALKVLRLRDDWPEAIREHRIALFRREAEALAKIEHRNVVGSFGSGESEGLPWLAMEFLQGQTLQEFLVGGRPDIGTVERIMFQLCGAVAAAHAAGVIHRDLKPANVLLVGDELQVKLADFGLAQHLGGPRLEELDPPGFSTAIRVGKQVGTPAFMPPEQTQGYDADLRSDVWSLGAVLYNLISGRRPFAGKTVRAVLTNVCTAEPEPLPDDLAPYLRGIVYKCLQKRPEWRFPTATEMVAALHDKRVVQLLPVGVNGPTPTALTGCPDCGAPIEHRLKCLSCHLELYRYTDGQVLAVPLRDGVYKACGTCGSVVTHEHSTCPCCGMVYSDLPPVGQAHSAHALEGGGPVVFNIFDLAMWGLKKCPNCSTPKSDRDLRCGNCELGFRAFVTGRVQLELATGGWSLRCGACGGIIPGPDEPHCPQCGLNLSNGMFPDGTRFVDELPRHLLKLVEDERDRRSR